MTNITFQYNASAVNGSGTGAGITTYGNGSTWQVTDFSGGPPNPGEHLEVLVGDTLYFSASSSTTNVELFAYDTSNQTRWLVSTSMPARRAAETRRLDRPAHRGHDLLRCHIEPHHRH